MIATEVLSTAKESKAPLCKISFIIGTLKIKSKTALGKTHKKVILIPRDNEILKLSKSFSAFNLDSLGKNTVGIAILGKNKTKEISLLA
jgi:hypothetical protein